MSAAPPAPEPAKWAADPLSFYATPAQRGWIERECARLGVTRSALIRSLVEDAMQADREKK